MFMNVPKKRPVPAVRLGLVLSAVLSIFALYSARTPTLAQGATPAATAQATPQCATITDSTDMIQIGASVPITGKYASGGVQIQDGYQLGVADVNQAGGVVVNCQRMKLNLTILDDASDPTKTVQNMETLFSSNQVVTYLGGFGSDLHAAAAGIAEKNKTPYLGVAFALYKIHQQGFKYLFSPFPKSPDLVKSAFDMLDSLSPKPTKVGIFAEKTDWGAEMEGLWSQEAQKRGYQLTTDQNYAPGATDFSTMILQAKNAGTEVIMSLPNPPDGIAILKQMKELAYTPKVTFVVRAADGASWGKTLGKDGDDVLNMPGWNPAVKFPGVPDMLKRFKTQFNTDAQATAGPAYAVIQILADAIQRAGSIDRDAIRDAIAATNLTNIVIGSVSFNPDGTGKVTTIINQYQAGQQVLVWPPDQAAGTLIYPAPAFADR
jgi:branched-chain amino acid transport system substrate-binding protein